MRAFYRIAKPLPDEYGVPGILLHEDDDAIWVACAEPVDGQDSLGGSWAEFWQNAPEVRGEVFLARVERDCVSVQCRAGSVLPTDVVQSAWIVPWAWMGDELQAEQDALEAVVS